MGVYCHQGSSDARCDSGVQPVRTHGNPRTLGILVCADTRKLVIPGFWVQDCAAATQNLLIAAHALGLGAVWTGVYPMDGHVAGFARHCQLPDGVVPLAFVVIGHPAEELKPQDRFNEHKIHSNVW